MQDNPNCPDYFAHNENAADRMFPGWRNRPLTDDQSNTIDAATLAEYLECEGH